MNNSTVKTHGREIVETHGREIVETHDREIVETHGREIVETHGREIVETHGRVSLLHATTLIGLRSDPGFPPGRDGDKNLYAACNIWDAFPNILFYCRNTFTLYKNCFILPL